MQYNKLVIAEKPSLARAIAGVIGSQTKKTGYIEVKNSAVTWCYGHLLQQAPPDKYGWEQWRLDTLPMIPDRWIYEPRQDKQVKAQIKTIKQLSGKAKEIVHAGDPDREGQLLVDEILEYLQIGKPVKRIWLSATDPKSVGNALSALEDNRSYVPLKEAALARSKADWLVGMNLTRAATLTAGKQGNGVKGPLSIGRVQTPTLAIVVARDREIENHVSKDYYVPTAKIQHIQGEFNVAWQAGEQFKGLDEQGRLVDRQEADRLCNVVWGQNGKLVQVSEQNKSKKPDLPHRLSTLQKEAYSKHGMDPDNTLKIVQSLYERGIVSYPRTDCQYLPEEQLRDAGKVLTALKGCNVGAKNADSGLKSHAWNTSKVGAHHAIVPTGYMDNMGTNEKKVFEVVARGFVRQFYPDMKYVEQKVMVELGGEHWKATGRVVTDPGWSVVDGKKGDSSTLPRGMQKNDSVNCSESWVEEKKTSPPSRFSKASLLEAMSKVHNFVKNGEHKKKLKENSGLGTEATRTGIIESLVKRGLLNQSGKSIVSGEKGRALVDCIPESLRDPGVTALWEDALEMVASGSMQQDEFLKKQQKTVESLVKQMSSADFGSFENISEPAGKSAGKSGKKSGKKTKSKSGAQGKQNSGGEPQVCPECGEKSLYKRISKKGNYYWGCFNKDKHQDGKPVFRPDKS